LGSGRWAWVDVERNSSVGLSSMYVSKLQSNYDHPATRLWLSPMVFVGISYPPDPGLSLPKVLTVDLDDHDLAGGDVSGWCDAG
jgi:hypothetical protein